ncbi:MAG: hypothetical protein LBO20_05670 [Bifidobacteriaceae bacterium]|jgi:hypothetical protein|nr:hypothetical protein [Bifidobacteriaceae bacterium]
MSTKPSKLSDAGIGAARRGFDGGVAAIDPGDALVRALTIEKKVNDLEGRELDRARGGIE